MPTRTHHKSPYKYIVVRRPDGTQVNVSTKTTNAKVAACMADHVSLILDSDPTEPLKMIEALDIAETICNAANKKHRPPLPAIAYLRALLQEHTGSDVYGRMKCRVVDILEEVLSQCKRPTASIWDVTADDIGKFQALLVGLGRKPITIRNYTHTLSALFGMAVKRGVVTDNVVELVSKPPRPKNSPRRPFTDSELNKVLMLADAEWKGMILVALYTGLRLGDVSRLVYRDIDLKTRHIRAAVKKTGGFEPKPIPKVLMRYFHCLHWPTNLDEPLFPRAYRWAMTGCRSIGSICDAFRDLLIRAGVRKPGEPSRGIKFCPQI